MSPLAIFGVLVALVAVATAAGLIWRRTQGRATVGAGSALGILGLRTGRATIVQFSSPVCAPCVATRAVIGDLAASRPWVDHIELDVTEHPQLASKWAILQTPTVLVVDRSGEVRTRIGGAPRRAELERSIDALESAEPTRFERVA